METEGRRTFLGSPIDELAMSLVAIAVLVPVVLWTDGWKPWAWALVALGLVVLAVRFACGFMAYLSDLFAGRL